MPRSPVLSGRIDARDRAHQRHRRDRSTAAPLDDYTKLERWLEASRLGGSSREELLRLNLDEYLHDTAHVEVNASERLRHLAIYLEGTSEAGAVALDRLIEPSPSRCERWRKRASVSSLRSSKNAGFGSDCSEASAWLKGSRRVRSSRFS